MKVFVSSTSKDLKSFREPVRRAIQRLGHQPIMMEDFNSSTNPPKQECFSKINESDVLIGIYAYRYGYVPRGDNTSITEQEYRHARAKGKKIFCFIISPNATISETHQDDDERLSKFKKEIQANHTVSFFESPEDLVLNLAPVVVEVFEKQMGKWQRVANKKDNRDKLDLINNLIGRNNQGELSDAALKSSTKLLASDFFDFSSSTTFEFIDCTGELLKGNIQISDYIRRVNKLAIEYKPLRRWNEKTKDNIKRLWKSTLISILIGFICGIIFYVLNMTNIRSISLFQKTDQTKLANWLIDKKIEGKIKIDDFESEETQNALDMLSMAIELDPDANKTHLFFEMISRDINRRISYYKNPPPELLLENLNIFRKLDLKVPDEAKTIKALIATSIITHQEKDPKIGYDELLSSYEQLLRKHNANIDNHFYKQKIDSLKQARDKFEFQKAKQANENMTLLDLIKSWENFVATKKNDSPEKSYATEEIKRLNTLLKTYATVKSDENFVTCRGVNDSRQPFGVTDRFSSGTIWIWAKINAPRKENITFKWYTKDGLYHTNEASIPMPSNSYRIYFAKSFGKENEGINEVRLYNSQNILIGRKVFYINK